MGCLQGESWLYTQRKVQNCYLYWLNQSKPVKWQPKFTFNWLVTSWDLFEKLIENPELVIIRRIITAPCNNMQTLKFKTQLTITFFAAVNHNNYNDNQQPWKKMDWHLPITTHRRDLLFPERSAEMIDSTDWAEFACYWKVQWFTLLQVNTLITKLA